MNRAITALLLMAGVAFAGGPVTPPGVQIGGSIPSDGNFMMYTNGVLWDSGITDSTLNPVPDISGKIDTIILNGTTITTATGSVDLGGYVVNVKSFGAMGDDDGAGNGTDDTAAIQSAIDASEANLLPLYFPPGIYKITDTLTLVPTADGTVVYGAGQTRTTIQQYTTGKSGLVIDSSVGGNLYEGLTVRDIKFKGLDETGVGLHVAGGEGSLARCFIQGIICSGWGTGCLMDDTDQSMIIGAYFSGNGVGLEVDGNSNAMNIMNSLCNDNTSAGFNILNGTGVSIISCDLGNSNHAAPQLAISNPRTYIQGCNFEVHNDASCIIVTNNTQLTVDSCNFVKIAAATWTNPPICLAEGAINTDIPILYVRNNLIEGTTDTDTPFVRRWGDDIQVHGSPRRFVTDGADNKELIEYVTGVYPAITEIKDRRHISPFPIAYQTVVPEEQTTAQIYWKVDSNGAGEDDLVAVYATDQAAWASSSLLNNKILEAGNTWSADQNFTTINIAANENIVMGAASDIIVSTGYGCRIGYASAQNANDPKMVFFEASAPVDQPEQIADATDAATAISQLNLLLAAMRELGLIKDGTSDTL